MGRRRIRRFGAGLVALALLLGPSGATAGLGLCLMDGRSSYSCCCKDKDATAATSIKRSAGCCCDIAEPSRELPATAAVKPAPSGKTWQLPLHATATAVAVVAPTTRHLNFDRGPPGPATRLFITFQSLLI
ncbi:MAG: hypothetical protein VCA74_05775 [Deltaproteobacteria bacterium]